MIWCRSSGIPLCSLLMFTFCSIHFPGLAKQVLIWFTKAILSQEANSPPLGFSEFSIVFPFLVHFPGVCTTKSTSVISEGWHSGVVQYFEALTALCCLFPAQDFLLHSVLEAELFHPWKFYCTVNEMRRTRARESTEEAGIYCEVVAFLPQLGS